MDTAVETLLGAYETGRISRRDRIASLSALTLASSGTRAQGGLIRVSTLNHVTLYVSGVDRSTAFYQEVLGLPELSRQSDGVNLAAGDSFVGLYPAGARSVEPQINHFCLGVEQFNQSSVLETLAGRGIEAEVRIRDDTVPEIYFNYPDDLRVQLQDVSYCGGSGSLGNVCP
jgi:catechol 2,3-dioxygenase-like lactoylglutathione lyase family enzyme